MRNRTIQVKAMLNRKEKAHFDRQLAVTGLTKSMLLRKLIMDEEVQPKGTDDVKETYRLVANLTNNTNQIAKIANATGYIDPGKIDSLLIMVDKCWKIMQRII